MKLPIAAELRCIPIKLFRRDFSTIYKLSEPMVKMTNRKIKLGIDGIIKKGETVDDVANTFHVSLRRIEQLVKILKDTGKYLILKPGRRPKVYLCFSNLIHQEKKQ